MCRWPSSAWFNYTSCFGLEVRPARFPLPFNCQPGSGQQMVDCFVKYLCKPPSLPPSLGIRFTDGSAPSMEAASQTDGRWKSTIAPSAFLFSEKRPTHVSGCYGDLAFLDDSDPSAARRLWKRENESGGDLHLGFCERAHVCFLSVRSCSLSRVWKPHPCFHFKSSTFTPSVATSNRCCFVW